MLSINKIVRYEGGEMSQEEMVEFFQEMINDGSVWTLQGHYGRTAAHLIEAGLCEVASPQKQCAMCHGTGTDPDRLDRECSVCEGAGRVTIN